LSNFISSDPNCENSKVLGQSGYIYNNPLGPFSTALYRCRQPFGDRYITIDRNCEGTDKVNEGKIGYVMSKFL